jgi:hypothetical protein
MTVTPGSIVEGLNVIKDIGSSQVAGFVDALTDALFFQGAKEGFSHCIVPTAYSGERDRSFRSIVTAAHARVLRA